MKVTVACSHCTKEFTYERKEGQAKGRPRKVCDDCQKTPEYRLGTRRARGKSIRVLLSDKDEEMITRLAGHLGTSNQEAVRTAVRVYEAIINQKK